MAKKKPARAQQEPLLDVAMIVKNEEKDLPRTLASLRALTPILGRVCVYDTGSTDRTVSIARAAGAKVVQGYWDDDFSRARNESLAMTTSEWFLVVDADEVVVADAGPLGNALRAARDTAVNGFTSPLAIVSSGRITTMVPSLRLGRRGRIHYVNRLHERHAPIDPAENLVCSSLPDSVLMVAHYGYVPGEPLARRAERNLRISLLEHDRVASGTPDEQVEALLNRGRSYLLAGGLTEGLTDLSAAWDLTSAKTAYRQWAGEMLAEVRVQVGYLEEAEAMLPGLSAAGSTDQLLRYIRARVAQARGQHEEALRLIRLVDKPVRALQRTESWGPVLRLRMISAAATAQSDEAIAAGVALFTRHGQCTGLGPLLLSLWAERSDEALVRLLTVQDSPHFEAICAELDRAGGRGVEVARAIRTRSAVSVETP